MGSGFDLAVLASIVFFGVWGAFTGASRQVANFVALPLAYLVAAPCGQLFGSVLAKRLTVSLAIGTVIASALSFFLVFLVARAAVGLAVARLLSGKDPQNRSADRAIGAALGATKMAFIAYVVVSALSFLEDNVALAGRRFQFVSKGSVVMRLGRRFNLFELTQFGGANDLMRALKMSQDPSRLSKLKADRDFVALQSDPQFRAVLESGAVKKALETKDVRALLQNDEVLKLLSDPKALRHIERLAERSAE